MPDFAQPYIVGHSPTYSAMDRWTATTEATVWGSRNAWSLSEQAGYKKETPYCSISIEIQGDAKNGFHFVMSPEGFFTADTWHETWEEAIQLGNELFDLNLSDWTHIDP